MEIHLVLIALMITTAEVVKIVIAVSHLRITAVTTIHLLIVIIKMACAFLLIFTAH